MGQQNNPQLPCQNLFKPSYHPPEDLVFYTEVEDHQFGKVPIYTSTKRPSSFIAKVQRTIVNSKIFNIFQKIQNSQLQSLASLHAFQIRRDKYFTGAISEQITSFWEYNNFSFEDFLRMRIQKRIHFSEKQLWLIIKACCESFSLFNHHNLVLDLDLNHMMVIPQKKLKIYWHHLQVDNSHLSYYQKMKQFRNNKNTSSSCVENRQFKLPDHADQDNFFFSPQQIEGIQKRQQTMNINFTRANSFRLGMILLYCITLTNPIKTCYGLDRLSGCKKIKLMVLNSLYETKVELSERFNDDLKHLIKLLLLQDPNKRIPLDCLQNVYEKYISLETQLQMGINENPVYIPSSSRNNLLQQPQKLKQQQQNFSKPEYEAKNYSRRQSQKIIIQSQVRSCQRQYGDKIQDQDSHNSKEQEPFDKFDTKTIKISSTYNKR